MLGVHLDLNFQDLITNQKVLPFNTMATITCISRLRIRRFCMGQGRPFRPYAPIPLFESIQPITIASREVVSNTRPVASICLENGANNAHISALIGF